MKKQSFRNRSALIPAGSRTLGTIVLGIVLVLGSVRFTFPDFFFSLMAPVFGTGGAVFEMLRTGTGSFTNSATLIQERDALQTENETLKNENKILSAERAALADLGTPVKGTVVADVIAGPPLSPYDVLILDRGSEQGVSNGQFVTAAGGVPIGILAEVTPTSAHAVLFSMSGRETPGWAGSKHVGTTFKGTGGGTIEATLPKDAPIIVGDEVFIGEGGKPFGTIGRIDSSPSSPTLLVHVKPYVNMFSVREVLIVPAHSL